jgi:hypothetical protein
MQPASRAFIAFAGLLIAVTVGVLSGAAVTHAEQQEARCKDLGTLVVLVRDARTKVPIPLANVLDTGRQSGTMADQAGIAVLNCVAPGMVRVRVYTRSYLAKVDSALVHAGAVDTLRVELRFHRERGRERTLPVPTPGGGTI